MPYVSDAQRRLFHAKANRGEISKATVEHWDKATKGKKLPEYVGKEKKAFGPLLAGVGRAALARGAGAVGRVAPAARRAVNWAERNPFMASNMLDIARSAMGGGNAASPMAVGSGYGTPGVPSFKNYAPKPEPLSAFGHINTQSVKKAEFISNFKRAFHSHNTLSKDASAKVLEKLAGIKFAEEKEPDVVKSLTKAIGVPFVAGNLGGAALAKTLSPTDEDVDILKKQELLAHYDDAIATLQRRIMIRSAR